MYLNHVIPSSRCLPPIPGRTFKSSFGHSVGKRHHLKLFQKKLLDYILFLLSVTKFMFSTHWWVMKVRESNWSVSNLSLSIVSQTHRLWPLTRAFQALVPSGSMWIPVPDLAGPITNHLWKKSQNMYPVYWELYCDSSIYCIYCCLSHNIINLWNFRLSKQIMTQWTLCHCRVLLVVRMFPMGFSDKRCLSRQWWIISTYL